MRPIILAVLASVAGCQSVPDEQSPAGARERPVAQPKAVAQPKIAPLDVRAVGKADVGALKDSASILSKRSIFFAYDRFDVQEEYRPVVEAHAKYLRENPGARILIQGNADERGSREYNLALGQRRSDNVKKVLLLLGAKEAQIESVSLGEEKPRCSSQAEDCWSKNRRGDLLYAGEF